MNKYEQGKIYKIVSNIYPLPYYGSTIQTLKRRLQDHEYARNRNLQMGSQKVLSYGDYEIQLVQNYPCKNREELLKREDYYIKKYPNCNKKRSYVCREEYNKRNKEWREKNKTHRKEYMKQWRKKNEKHCKDYQKNNMTKIKEKRKIYLRKKRQIKFNCPCGGKYSSGRKSDHAKTQMHQRYLQN